MSFVSHLGMLSYAKSGCFFLLLVDPSLLFYISSIPYASIVKLLHDIRRDFFYFPLGRCTAWIPDSTVRFGLCRVCAKNGPAKVMRQQHQRSSVFCVMEFRIRRQTYTANAKVNCVSVVNFSASNSARGETSRSTWQLIYFPRTYTYLTQCISYGFWVYISVEFRSQLGIFRREKEKGFFMEFTLKFDE